MRSWCLPSRAGMLSLTRSSSCSTNSTLSRAEEEYSFRSIGEKRLWPSQISCGVRERNQRDYMMVPTTRALLRTPAAIWGRRPRLLGL